MSSENSSKFHTKYLLASQSGGVKCTKSPGTTLSVCIHKTTSFFDTIANDSNNGECISPSLFELPWPLRLNNQAISSCKLKKKPV